MKKVILLPVFLVIGFLTGQPASCYAGFGDLGPYFSYTYGDGGLPSNLYSIAGQTASVTTARALLCLATQDRLMGLILPMDLFFIGQEVLMARSIPVTIMQ